MTDEPSAPARPEIPESMRAAVLFGPGDIRVVDRPVPRPAPDEVLVRVAMCGMCGTDLKIYDGHFPQTPPFGDYVPGHEWTGTVAATGSLVDEFAPGDRVCIEAHRGCGRCDNCLIGKYTACLNYGDRAKGHRATGMTADGGFAEYAVHHVSSLYRLPPSLSFEDAVLISTAGTGLYGLDVAGGYVAGLDVAVFGPGPVGLTTVQVLKALGANQVILVGTRRETIVQTRIEDQRPTPVLLSLRNDGARREKELKVFSGQRNLRRTETAPVVHDCLDVVFDRPTKPIIVDGIEFAAAYADLIVADVLRFSIARIMMLPLNRLKKICQRFRPPQPAVEGLACRDRVSVIAEEIIPPRDFGSIGQDMRILSLRRRLAG